MRIDAADEGADEGVECFRPLKITEVARACDQLQLRPRDQMRELARQLRAAGISLVLDLVLFLDDLQWADDDSLALLQEIMRAPAPSGLLIVGTMRPPRCGVTSVPPSASAA